MTQRLRTRALLTASAMVAGLGLVAFPGTASGSTAAIAPASDYAAASTAETRDPLAWPFARDSIWNTPVGSGGRYVPAGLQAANASYKRITIDPEHISVDPTAPVKTLQAPGQPGHDAQVRVTSDLAHSGSWNGCASLLTADGTAVWQGQPLRLTPGGNPTWQWTTQRNAVDLRGQGIEGCHGGSHMSGIGGSIRVGELSSPAPLRHALKINLYCKKYCSTSTSGKRWPALTADAYYASGYGGTNSAVKMGSLLALPPGTDLSSLTDPKARKIAVALRDFGGYVVDDTAWDVHALSADKKVVSSGEWPVTGAAFHEQLQRVFQQLAVIDNNSSTSVGGGGTPRAPLAPCFTGDAACQGNTMPAPAPDPPLAPLVPVCSVSPAPTTTAETALGSAQTCSWQPGGSTSSVVDPFVSQLAPAAAISGWGPYERDLANGGTAAGDGPAQILNGNTYSRGVGVHAASSLTYDLSKQFAHFSTDVGVDDSVGAAGSVVFEVWVDGVPRWSSGRMTGTTGSKPVSMSVSGASTLRLVVTDAGDGNDSDHADWAGARLWTAK